VNTWHTAYHLHFTTIITINMVDTINIITITTNNRWFQQQLVVMVDSAEVAITHQTVNTKTK